MPKASPLDLAAVDPAIWYVFVKDTVYGPYTLGQLQGFVAEGRVTQNSLVSKGDSQKPQRASKMAELQAAFIERARSEAPEAPAAPSGPASNYVIVTQLDRTSDVDLIICMNGLGEFASVFPGTFILSSTYRLRDIQRALHEATTLDDQIMIVNASSGRLGWLNIGTDTDIHLREIWAKADDSKTEDET